MRSNIRAMPQLPRLSHQAGNASADGVPFHDWIIGHFVPPELASVRRSILRSNGVSTTPVRESVSGLLIGGDHDQYPAAGKRPHRFPRW